jgi:hypothetical protein
MIVLSFGELQLGVETEEGIMQQIARFNNFTDACEHFLFTLATDAPLTEVQARLVAYYCHEISIKVQPRLGDSATSL